MAETARLAVFHGTGRPFEIREYPVPEPEPGAMLIKIALANVCGSDMHYWRGEQDYVKMGRPLPLNTGHEHVGTVAKLGAGRHRRLDRAAAHDRRPRALSLLLPLRALQGLPAPPVQVLPHAPGQLARLVRGVAALPGRLRPVLLPAPESRRVQDRARDHRRDGGRHQLRVHAGLCGTRHRPAPRRTDRGHPGCRRARRLRLRGGARDGREPRRGDRRARRAARAGQAVRRDRRGRHAPALDAGRADRRRQEAHRRLGRRRGARAGRPSGRGRRRSPHDGARGHLPRDRQHQRGLEGRVRSVVDHLRQPADHRARPLRGRAPPRRARSHAAHARRSTRGDASSPTSSRSSRSTRRSSSRTRATSPAPPSSRTKRRRDEPS